MNDLPIYLLGVTTLLLGIASILDRIQFNRFRRRVERELRFQARVIAALQGFAIPQAWASTSAPTRPIVPPQGGSGTAPPKKG